MKELADILKLNGLKLSVVESCTGGLFMSRLTDVPGASEVFECGFVTYTDMSKYHILGVNPYTLSLKGAVSSETVSELLDGLKAETNSDVFCAVSGIAGPSGGSKLKPVGTVYAGFCLRNKKGARILKFNFEGSRIQIKNMAVDRMCEELKKYIREEISR
ncbi:MAG: CinA family protein [Candidatus Delongbacteria bacterium]